MVRYDLQIQLWQQRSDSFDTLINTWQSTNKLPTAPDAGLPAPQPN